MSIVNKERAEIVKRKQVMDVRFSEQKLLSETITWTQGQAAGTHLESKMEK